MCKSQLERLAIASSVSIGISAKIEDGAPNIESYMSGRSKKFSDGDRALGHVRNDAELAMQVVTSQLKSETGMLEQLAYFRMVKNSAKHYGVAQCGEYSGYVYWKLYKRGVFPIAMIQVGNVEKFGNHAFITIGLDSTETSQDMKSWCGKDIVICDPWLMQLLNRQGLGAITATEGDPTPGAYTPEAFIEKTKAIFKDGTQVNRAFSVNEKAFEVPKLSIKK